MVRIYGVTTKSNSGGTAVVVRLFGSTQHDGTVNLTQDGNPETLSNIFSTPANKSIGFVANITAYTEPAEAQLSASWNIHGVLRKGSTSNTVALSIGQADCVCDTSLEGATITLSENPILGGLSILCKGLAQYNIINWVATISGSEV